MSISLNPGRIGIALMASLLVCFGSTALTPPRPGFITQAANGRVTLTVTSSCGSASVMVKSRGVQTTPFTVTLPRGKTIKLTALDDSLPQCGALSVVSPFRRFVVDQTPIAEGKSRVRLTLDQDTAVLLQYGEAAGAPATLSVFTICTAGAPILVSENTANGQSGYLRTHFDADFLQGQSVRLEALSELYGCFEADTGLYFLNWAAGGKVYPQNQTAIDLTLGGFTSAYASYTGGISLPTLRINSYQLRRNGEPVDYVPVGENLNEFTFLVSGEPFPPEATVSFFPPVLSSPADYNLLLNGVPAEIFSRADPTQIEVRLPAFVTNAPAFGFVRVRASDSRSNSVPIEFRSQ